MTLPFSSSILRPLLMASLIGALFLSGIIWLSIQASASRRDAADWTEHTVDVLRAIREADEQLINDNADPRPMFLEIQALTIDNDSQQRRIQPLLNNSTKKELQLGTLSLRAEEHRLLAGRVARWRNDARSTDWLMFSLAGLIGILVIVTICLIAYRYGKHERKVELLAMNIDTAFNASPDSIAYSDIQELMREIRTQVRGNKKD